MMPGPKLQTSGFPESWYIGFGGYVKSHLGGWGDDLVGKVLGVQT